MSIKYQIWLNGKDLKGLVKEYPFKIQVVIWCILHGYIYYGGSDFGFKNGYYLSPDVEIRKVKK